MTEQMAHALQVITHADTKWVYNKLTSISRRGISDYNRIISFTRKLTDEEKEALRLHINKQDDNPGWTGVRHQGYNEKKGIHYYGFYTCWDSSD